jgi:hypothetical protein
MPIASRAAPRSDEDRATKIACEFAKATTRIPRHVRLIGEGQRQLVVVASRRAFGDHHESLAL